MPNSWVKSPIVTVVVGTDDYQEQLEVHAKCICDRSKFFANALQGDWVENQSKLIRLPEDDPIIFTMYLLLAYDRLTPEDMLDTGLYHDDYLSQLYQLYVLSEKLIDTQALEWLKTEIERTLYSEQWIYKPFSDRPDFKILESAMEGAKIVKVPKHLPTMGALQVIYDGTPEGDGIRHLFVDMFAKHGEEKTSICFIRAQIEQFPEDFLRELADELEIPRPLPDAIVKLKPELDVLRSIIWFKMKEFPAVVPESPGLLLELFRF